MNKLLKIILICSLVMPLSIAIYAQEPAINIGNKNGAVKTLGRHYVDSMLAIPFRLDTNKHTYLRAGPIYQLEAPTGDTSSGVWYFNGQRSLQLANQNYVIGTFVPFSRQLTINSVTQDLSADRTWNVGTVLGVTGTVPIYSSGGTNPAISVGGLTTIGSTGQLVRSNGTTWEYFTPTYISANQTITLSQDVTGSGTTSIVTTIANDAVTYAKMQNVSSTSRFIGRITAAAGDPEELTGTQATTLLDVFTSALKGVAPASGGGSVNYLRADGTWAPPPGTIGITSLNTDVVATGPGAAVATIQPNVVTYAKFQQVAANSLVGNATGVLANATGITLGATLVFSAGALQTTAFSGDFTSSANSFVGTLNTVNSNVGIFTNATVTANAKGLITSISSGTAPVTSVSGTANRITSTGGTTPVIDIAATYVGQTSITTLGTITAGTWNGTLITTTYTEAKLTSANNGLNVVSNVAKLGGVLTAGTTLIDGAGQNLYVGYTGNAINNFALSTTNLVQLNNVTATHSTLHSQSGSNINLSSTTIATSVIGGITIGPSTVSLYADQLNTDVGAVRVNSSSTFATLTVNGSISTSFYNLNGSTTAGMIHSVYNASGAGGYTLNLPTAASSVVLGRMMWINNPTAGTITIDPNSTDLIDGASTLVLPAGSKAQIVGTTTGWVTLSLSSNNVTSGSNTGDVTLVGENYLSITNQVITANAVNLSGTHATGTLAAARFPALTGDITNTVGTLATAIAANAVTNTKLADMATQTFKGRTTAATGDPEDLTIAQAKTMLNLTGTNSGDITLAAIGATPNANGATLAGQVLNLQPASENFGGIITTGAQNFEGVKTGKADWNWTNASGNKIFEISKMSNSAYIMVNDNTGATTLEIFGGGGSMTAATGILTFAEGTIPLVQGSTIANGDITINGTNHVTKTTSYVNLQPTGGNVGVGNTNPLAKLHVTGGFLAEGTTGANPVNGAGTRMVWIPNKFTLVAATTTGTHLDTDSIGTYNIITGWDSKNLAGFGAVFGRGNSVYNNYALVGGQNNYASGLHNFVAGNGNYVYNNAGAALGSNDTTAGNAGFTVGQGNKVLGHSGMALGYYLKSYVAHSTVVGEHNDTISAGPYAMFVVGAGTSDPTRHNAMVVRKTGETVLGTNGFIGGSLTFNGATSGAATISVDAAAGTPALLLPTTSSRLVGDVSTQTLTNKRWTPRVGSTTSSATPSINTDNNDIYKLTAQTADITSFTTNLTGTPVDGDILEVQITGTAARAITWGASFVASTVALPTTTVTTATLTTIFQYYTTSSYGNNKWVCASSY